MEINRRDFILASSGFMLGLSGLKKALAAEVLADSKLVSTKYLSVPAGFKVQLISRTGDAMQDGFFVPGLPDGMGTFDMGKGLIAIIRNHEIGRGNRSQSPFRADGNQVGGYDPGCIGGCTTIIYDVKKQAVVRQFLSLIGTENNCSGGTTSWGTWISSEENVAMPDGNYSQPHGFNFEVRPSLLPQLAAPVPLKAMGRFNHESADVDPQNGWVYQTEDRDDGLFYRFIPSISGKLDAGGKLQALMIRDAASYDTRNWDQERVVQGQRLQSQWVDLYDVESPKDDLRHRGFAQGAAKFARGEGTCYASGSIYFTATSGGRKRRGQVWKYTADETGGELELFVEADDPAVMKSPDNLCLGPGGDLFICEDGKAPNRLLRVNAKGEVRVFAENIFNGSELAGVCFSPDGSTMFVNIQHDPGITLAVTGPWLT